MPNPQTEVEAPRVTSDEPALSPRSFLAPGPIVVGLCLLSLIALFMAHLDSGLQDQLVAVILLVMIFAIAMWRDISMGVVAMPVAFLVGTFYFHMASGDIAKGFPGGLVTTLIGVTYMFGVARSNGTIRNIVRAMVSAVHGKVSLIPWVFFILAAAITASGALSLATYAILIPLGLSFCRSHKISPLLMGLSILNGTNAGGFSPIALYYIIVSGALRKADIPVQPLPIFFWTFVVNVILNLFAFAFFGGARGDKLKINPTKITETSDVTIDGLDATSARWTPTQVLTMVLFVCLVGAAVIFKLDVGYLAFVVALVLAIVDPASGKQGTKEIGWGVVLLVAGIVTFIGVLESAGVIAKLSQSVAHASTPMISALFMLIVAALVSAFASTNAMFIVLVPLAAPLLLIGGVDTLGFTIALCLSASVVDSSPFSNAGALMLANTDDYLYDRTMKWLMVWAFGMIPVAPLLTWLAFVVL